MSVEVRYLQTGMVDGSAPADNDARKISWVFSNEDVALDMHTIRTAGWDLDDYLRNPVLLFAHDQESPPIGRVTRIEKRGALLVGDSVFADAETYPFADTIYRLVKGGFLNATSVSWFPLEFKAAKDRNRPEGVDFLRQKLLEISVVPVPANPAALATARALGHDLDPLRHWAERILDEGGAARRQAETIYRETKLPMTSRASKEANWKCGASRNLPFDEESSWDGTAAQKAVFEACGFDGDKPDLSKARKAFLVYDAANPKEKGSYKLPFATIADGRLTAVAAGIRAAASRLSQTDIPESVQDSARAVIDHYEAKMSKEEKRAAARPKLSRALIAGLHKRGLYEVADLCYYISGLMWIAERVAAEAAAEKDNSPIPDRLSAWLDEGNDILAAMAAEETAENKSGIDDDEIEIDEIEAERALRMMFSRGKRAGKKLSKADKENLEGVHDHCMRSARLVRTHIDHYKNEDLGDDDKRAAMFDNAEAVHDHCSRSAQMLREHIDGRSPDDGDGDEKPADAKSDRGGNNSGALGDDGNRSAEDRRKRAAELRAKALIEAE